MSTEVSVEVLEPWRPRQSRYKDSYCTEIVDFMGGGHSATAFAGEIGVSRDTLYEWRGKYPDFLEAMKVGQAKRVLFWEREHINITRTGEGMIVGSIFALKNADPTDPEGYRDRHEIIGMPAPQAIDETLIAQRVAFLLMQGMPQ